VNQDGDVVFPQVSKLTLEIHRRYLTELQTAKHVVRDSSVLMASLA